MIEPDNFLSKLQRWRTGIIALGVLGVLVWAFIHANPWLIGLPILGSVLALLWFVLVQPRTESPVQPQNIIPLQDEIAARQKPSEITDLETLSSVLIVEDNPVALKTLSKLFTALGAQTVTETSSAEQALELLSQHKFTFILTDYRLGGMSGVQLLEHIRGSGDQTPVIILSATPDQPGVLRAASFDRTDFFGKPLRKAELSSAINRLAASA